MVEDSLEEVTEEMDWGEGDEEGGLEGREAG